MSYDDNFTLNKEYTVELCNEIIKRNLDINLIACTRVDCVDELVISKLKQAGLTELGFGIESGNQYILDKIGKKTTLSQIKGALSLAKSVGIITYGTAMIGNPYETKKTVRDTIGFLSSLKDLDVAMLAIATPLPGTSLYEMASTGKGGLKMVGTKNPKGNRYGSASITVNDLSGKDLVNFQRLGLMRFYANPHRMLVYLRLSGWKNFLAVAIESLKTFLIPDIGKVFIKKYFS